MGLHSEGTVPQSTLEGLSFEWPTQLWYSLRKGLQARMVQVCVGLMVFQSLEDMDACVESWGVSMEELQVRHNVYHGTFDETCAAARALCSPALYLTSKDGKLLSTFHLE